VKKTAAQAAAPIVINTMMNWFTTSSREADKRHCYTQGSSHSLVAVMVLRLFNKLRPTSET
jgi:hypothetical protein